jgi:16S rRNA C967 or C1407 C5-methylase (RsmB/RsmF family)
MQKKNSQKKVIRAALVFLDAPCSGLWAFKGSVARLG